MIKAIQLRLAGIGEIVILIDWQLGARLIGPEERRS